MKRFLYTLFFLLASSNIVLADPPCMSKEDAKIYLNSKLPNGNFVNISKEDFTEYLTLLRTIADIELQKNIDNFLQIEYTEGMFYLIGNTVIIIPISECNSLVLIMDKNYHNIVLKMLGEQI